MLVMKLKPSEKRLIEDLAQTKRPLYRIRPWGVWYSWSGATYRDVTVESLRAVGIINAEMVLDRKQLATHVDVSSLSLSE